MEFQKAPNDFPQVGTHKVYLASCQLEWKREGLGYFEESVVNFLTFLSSKRLIRKLPSDHYGVPYGINPSGYHVVPVRRILVVRFDLGRLEFRERKTREWWGEMRESDSIRIVQHIFGRPGCGCSAPHQPGDVVPTRHPKISPSTAALPLIANMWRHSHLIIIPDPPPLSLSTPLSFSFMN